MGMVCASQKSTTYVHVPEFAHYCIASPNWSVFWSFAQSSVSKNLYSYYQTISDGVANTHSLAF